MSRRYCVRFCALVLALTGCVVEDSGVEVASTTAAIIGGTLSTAADAPWQVRIRSAVDSSVRCGGVLLDPLWVLTAAHCVTDRLVRWSDTRLVFGDTKISAVDAGEQERRIAFVVTHPDYNETALRNDLALIRLESPVTYTSKISPLAIAEIEAGAGWDVMASGWGIADVMYSDQLRRATLTVLSKTECQSRWNAAITPITITDDEVCAIHDETAMTALRNVRRGDSGGPLVVYIFGIPFLLGITSHVDPTNPEIPGVFMHAASYSEWINDVVFDSLWLAPSADAMVAGGANANTNYASGAAGTVRQAASASSDQEIYMKFNLSAVDHVEEATLWQYCSLSSGTGAFPNVRLRQLYSAGETWTESGLTWNNRYIDGRNMDQDTFSSTYSVPLPHAWRSADLTYRVEQQRGGTIAFRLDARNEASDRSIVCAMRETPALAYRPYLQVRFQ